MNIDAARSIRALLPNGLTVVCVPQPALHSAAMTLHVRVGSRFERSGDNGRSHFLEHMMFRGTPSYATAHDQALALERFGGTLYAATHADFGLMSLAVPPENFEPALALFAEIVLSPRFSDIELERAIVREEILESLDDDAQQIDPDNLSHALIFGEHPLGFPIAGSLESVAHFCVEDLREHHRVHYTARNAVLCLAGAIDPDVSVKWADAHFGRLPSGERAIALAPPHSQKSARLRYVENQTSQTDLRLAFRAPGEHDPDEAAAEALLRLLDDGMSTRLYAQVCDEKGLCYNVSADYETYEDDAVLDLAAVVQHARAATVMRELCDVVQRIAREGPSEPELRKVQTRHGWEARAMLDDAEALADFHGLATLAGIADTLQARHDEILAVTCRHVRDVARRIFRPENLSAVAVGLLDAKERDAVARVVRAFSTVDS